MIQQHEPLTKEEIGSLPRFARVAIAARCARRVQPLFNTWPQAPQDHVKLVGKAIEYAERVASDPPVTSDPPQVLSGNDIAPAVEGTAAQANGDRAAYPAHAAARAAGAAADAAFFATFTIQDRQVDHTPPGRAARDVTDSTAAAAAHAMEASSAAQMDTSRVAAAIRRDYERLRSEAIASEWRDATAVRPDFFGEMWPDGKPDGWPIGARNADDA